MSIFDQIMNGVGNFCDKAFSNGWMMIAIIVLGAIAVWAFLKWVLP